MRSGGGWWAASDGVLVTAALESVKLSSNALTSQMRTCGPVVGALLGLVAPLCSCGTSWPVAGSFIASGVPLPTVVAFLTATQSTGLDSAAVTYGLLGPQAALLRLTGAVVLAVASGLAVSDTGESFTTRRTERTNDDNEETNSLRVKLTHR